MANKNSFAESRSLPPIPIIAAGSSGDSTFHVRDCASLESIPDRPFPWMEFNRARKQPGKVA
jgi:hypothetical protein